MFSDQCISVTDLRRNTKKCLVDLKGCEKYVFINNKPIAVIIDIKFFEEIKKTSFLPELKELEDEEITPKIKMKAKKVKNMNPSEFINI